MDWYLLENMYLQAPIEPCLRFDEHFTPSYYEFKSPADPIFNELNVRCELDKLDLSGYMVAKETATNNSEPHKPANNKRNTENKKTSRSFGFETHNARTQRGYKDPSSCQIYPTRMKSQALIPIDEVDPNGYIFNLPAVSEINLVSRG